MICYKSVYRTFKHFGHLKALKPCGLGQLTLITICHAAHTSYTISWPAVKSYVAPEKVAEIINNKMSHVLIVKMPVNKQRHACQKTVWQRLAVNFIDYVSKREPRLSQIFITHFGRKAALEQCVDKELAKYGTAAFIA